MLEGCKKKKIFFYKHAIEKKDNNNKISELCDLTSADSNDRLNEELFQNK